MEVPATLPNVEIENVLLKVAVNNDLALDSVCPVAKLQRP
jgi:hypothetical protein